jgi:hypothetical protein
MAAEMIKASQKEKPSARLRPVAAKIMGQSMLISGAGQIQNQRPGFFDGAWKKKLC